MTSREIVFLIISIISIIIAILCFALWNKRKNDMSRLSNSIENYIQKGTLTHFSTSDNSFAPLQNAISDLENLIELEKNNTRTEIKKNSDFLADISHQLKTPLAGLRLYAELEDKANPNEHTKKEIQLIEKMENLIYRLLRLEKIKSDSYTMQFESQELSEIFVEVIDEFKPIFNSKQYIISGKSVIRCDKSWMIEAIGNLIKNACEHTDDDGIIKVDITQNDKSTTVVISDNGGGVAPEELSNLFTRFSKVKNTKPNSAGIGLAITKAIIEKHHGIIFAENKNSGLAVTICLPHIDGYLTY